MKPQDYFYDNALLRRIVHLYNADYGKEYNLPKNNPEVYDRFLVDLRECNFFRFRWIIDVKIREAKFIATQFGIKIPDEYVGGTNRKPIISKMYDSDKIRHLYMNLNKFTLIINDGKFKKERVTY